MRSRSRRPAKGKLAELAVLDQSENPLGNTVLMECQNRNCMLSSVRLPLENWFTLVQKKKKKKKKKFNEFVTNVSNHPR